ADNPGVWSLASENSDKATDLGSFPGGIACVVRYIELESDHHNRVWIATLNSFAQSLEIRVDFVHG
ncbi:hypothetical protein ABTP42_19845, partial [Acinetobacter baumannii]